MAFGKASRIEIEALSFCRWLIHSHMAVNGWTSDQGGFRSFVIVRCFFSISFSCKFDREWNENSGSPISRKTARLIGKRSNWRCGSFNEDASTPLFFRSGSISAFQSNNGTSICFVRLVSFRLFNLGSLSRSNVRHTTTILTPPKLCASVISRNITSLTCPSRPDTSLTASTWSINRMEGVVGNVPFRVLTGPSSLPVSFFPSSSLVPHDK